MIEKMRDVGSQRMTSLGRADDIMGKRPPPNALTSEMKSHNTTVQYVLTVNCVYYCTVDFTIVRYIPVRYARRM